jgi:hypothetical protein
MANPSPQQTSKSRQNLLIYAKAINRLIEELMPIREIVKGTVYKQKKKCGNPNCKCARGELHTANILSFSEEGHTRLLPLTKYSKKELSRIKSRVEQYRQFRKSRAEIVYYFKLLLEEINKLERSLLLGVPARKGGDSGTGKKR